MGQFEDRPERATSDLIERTHYVKYFHSTETFPFFENGTLHKRPLVRTFKLELYISSLDCLGAASDYRAR